MQLFCNQPTIAGHQLERSGLRIQVISLAAGIGRDAAILGGLIAVETVSGMVAVMDGDDQHPVETLGLPLERAGDGVLVAVAVSQDNPPGGSFFRRKTHDLGKSRFSLTVFITLGCRCALSKGRESSSFFSY